MGPVGPTLPSMQFLIIDDHPIVRHGIAAALQRLEGTVEILQAADGSEGLALLLEHPDLDAVLIDLDMQPLAGLPTIRQIRQISPRLPVLVVSGSEALADQEAAMAAGANGFYPKSAGLGALREAVLDILPDASQR